MRQLIEKKRILFHKLAKKTYLELSHDVQRKFKQYIKALAVNGYLQEPIAKKLDSEIFEIRVRINGAWIGLYAYLENDEIFILHIFQKKQNSTPKNDLITTKARLKSLIIK